MDTKITKPNTPTKNISITEPIMIFRAIPSNSYFLSHAKGGRLNTFEHPPTVFAENQPREGRHFLLTFSCC